MKKFLLLIVLVLVFSVSSFADAPLYRFSCNEEGLIFSFLQDVDHVAYVGWFPSTEQHFLGSGVKASNYYVPSFYSYVIVYFGETSRVADIPQLDCRNPRVPEATEIGKECLGIPYPGQGVFTIDGNEYSYHESLSFVVPLDAIWRWELLINGELILLFEQTAPGNCQITEDYREN